jgi:hypothetical protein
MFPPGLENDAFRASNGELGWSRAQIPEVVHVLCSHGFGILGGELWWIRDGCTDIVSLIPQRNGSPGVYVWETTREPEESWADFVKRGASNALAAVARWPLEGDLPPDLGGRILYNLTWASHAEFKK